MKKLLPGIIAVVLAVSCTAFVQSPNSPLNSLSDKKGTDPCADGAKQWFLINIPCDQQDLTTLRDPYHYHLSNTQEVTELCAGSECVCAILACHSAGDPYIPNISSETSIYTKLYNWYLFGMTQTGATIMWKEQE